MTYADKDTNYVIIIDTINLARAIFSHLWILLNSVSIYILVKYLNNFKGCKQFKNVRCVEFE